MLTARWMHIHRHCDWRQKSHSAHTFAHSVTHSHFPGLTLTRQILEKWGTKYMNVNEREADCAVCSVDMMLKWRISRNCWMPALARQNSQKLEHLARQKQAQTTSSMIFILTQPSKCMISQCLHYSNSLTRPPIWNLYPLQEMKDNYNQLLSWSRDIWRLLFSKSWSSGSRSRSLC